MASRPPIFHDRVSIWSTFLVWLGAYFEGNEITNAGKRLALLISLLSDSIVRFLQGHQLSVSINSLTYDDVVKCLGECYNSDTNEIAASYSFFMRRLLDRESVSD